MKTKNKNEQEYNLLTANVGNSAVAADIIQGILVDCDFKESTIDSLTMLFEAFATKTSLTDAQDFAEDLQRALFANSIDFDKDVSAYIERIKQGKNYKSTNTFIAN
jgi:hypothetical protein